ncbi:hypothetical protein BDN67DRAFT_985254, partial [Paxillus ammoniavirescens]
LDKRAEGSERRGTEEGQRDKGNETASSMKRKVYEIGNTSESSPERQLHISYQPYGGLTDDDALTPSDIMCSDEINDQMDIDPSRPSQQHLSPLASGRANGHVQANSTGNNMEWEGEGEGEEVGVGKPKKKGSEELVQEDDADTDADKDNKDKDKDKDKDVNGGWSTSSSPDNIMELEELHSSRTQADYLSLVMQLTSETYVTTAEFHMAMYPSRMLAVTGRNSRMVEGVEGKSSGGCGGSVVLDGMMSFHHTLDPHDEPAFSLLQQRTYKWCSKMGDRAEKAVEAYFD